MYLDLQTCRSCHEMRQPLHMLSKGLACVKQSLLEQGSAETNTREKGQRRNRNGDLTSEKSCVTSPETNVIL